MTSLPWPAMLALYLGLVGVLMAVGCPIAIALGVAAVAGIGLRHGTDLLPTIGDIVWNTGNSFTLVAIPMFILMGEIILNTGVSPRSWAASRGASPTPTSWAARSSRRFPDRRWPPRSPWARWPCPSSSGGAMP